MLLYCRPCRFLYWHLGNYLKIQTYFWCCIHIRYLWLSFLSGTLDLKIIWSGCHVQTQGYPINGVTVRSGPQLNGVPSQQVKDLEENKSMKQDFVKLRTILRQKLGRTYHCPGSLVLHPSRTTIWGPLTLVNKSSVVVNENLSFFILVNESGQTEGDNVVAAGHGREDTSRDVHRTCKSQ